MGTSLSGLTPATTFDGLLKTSDNDALDATLKTIGTGDGTDSVLQLSDSALKINRGQATIVGAGNDDTTISLLVQNSDAADMLKVTDDGITQFISKDAPASLLQITTANTYNGFKFVGNGYSREWRTYSTGTWFADSMALSSGFLLPTAKLQVKGTGATSATTSLLVQNSAGSDLMKVQDDGLLNIIGTNNDYNTVNFQIERSTGEYIFRARNRGALEIGSGIDWISLNSSGNGVRLSVSNSEIARVTATGLGIGESTPTAKLHVKGSGNDNTTAALLVQNSDGDELFKVQDDGVTSISTGPSYNAITITSDSINYLKRIGTGTGLAIGSSVFYPSANTQVQIKGSGATSATTALLVQNSAGADLLEVTDDGTTAISGTTQIQRPNGQILASFLGTAAVCDFNPTNNAGFDTRFRGGTDNFVLYIDAGEDNVGMGTNTPDASAKLEVDSTTQGFLPPRMTTEQKGAIQSPAAGLMVYDTVANQMSYYNGTGWVNF